MKKYLVLSIAMLFALVTLVESQESSFDKEASSFHKKAIMTCGMIKSQNPDLALITKNIAELEAGINNILKMYMNNPPAEYAKDVNWNSYLLSLKENLTVVKERVEKKEYLKASFFCPYFCNIFGKMHKINGTTDLTDIMFSWRMEIKNTTDMFNAGNISGTMQNVKRTEESYQNLLKMKAAKNNETFESLFAPLEQIYVAWLNAIKKSESEKINESYNSFMKAFSKPYLSTL